MVRQWRCGPRAEPAAPLATKTSRKVRNVTAPHPSRHFRWSLLAAPVAGVLVLAGCSGSADDGGDSTDDPAATGFSIMVAQANDADDFYAQIAAAYTEETGIEIEVIPYPSDAYNTQVTTQFQAGNAADVAILSPGHGPADLGHHARRGRLPGAARRHLGRRIPEAPSRVPSRRRDLRAAHCAHARRHGLQRRRRRRGRRRRYPETYDDLLEACTTARDGGKTFTVLAGGIRSTRACSRSSSRRPASTQETPDWNEQRAAGDVTFADSGWSEVLEDIVEMNDAGCFQDGAAGGTFDTITQGSAAARR